MAREAEPTPWFAPVQSAYPQELCQRIYAEAAQQPRLCGLFAELANYTLAVQQQQQQQSVSQQLPTNTKKRKLDPDFGSAPAAQANGSASGAINNGVVSFECKDVSVQIPARKKLKLSLIKDAHNERRAEVRLLNPTTDELEYALPADHIENVFAMPVPDKQARQAYFAVFPKADTNSTDGKPAEQIVFTLGETSPPSAATSSDIALTEDDTYVSVTEKAFEKLLAAQGKRIIRPDAAEFASSRPQPHRKGEKAYHVNAHRGSKEGYLYFLPNGILFGFKKPLAFFSFANIESISYTSVLQRTFNLVVAASDPSNLQSPDEIKETEFSMLDQEDFAGIDDYVKRHGLNDASMAADRRAKAYNVNKERKVEGEVNAEIGASGVDADERTEIEKAEQQLQDEEDEEEEDYEASGGESDGEGEESEEDDEGGEDEEVYDDEEEDGEGE